MALTLSYMLVLGTKVAQLTLLNTANVMEKSLNDYRGQTRNANCIYLRSLPVFYRPIKSLCCRCKNRVSHRD